MAIVFWFLIILAFFSHRILTNSINSTENNHMKLRSISKVISAFEQSEGVGATVRRSIGVMNNRKFNPFLMCDHFYSYGEGGFPEHPHKGQETISLILEGAMAHEDFTGSKGILYAGDLQFMTAGKGIVHSEMPVASPDAPTSGIQLWVDLPDSLKDTEPRYRDLRSWEIPEVVKQDGKLSVKVISGKAYGVESVKDLAYTPIQYYYYKMKAGAKFEQELPLDFNFFLYVLKGNSLVLNNDVKTKKFHSYFFSNDGDHLVGENVATDSTEEDVEFVLIGGKELEQETVQYGPFVASSRTGIQKAFEDYQYGRNGFENVKNWRTLISHGVTKDMINGPLDGNLEKREQDRLAYLKEHGIPHDTSTIEPVKVALKDEL